MTSICETPNNKVVFTLQPRNYTQVYNRLKVLLKEEQYLLFARPDNSGSKTLWTTELKGVKPQDLRSFTTLTDEERDLAADQLEEMREAILKVLATDKDLAAISDNLFQVPTEEDIKVWVRGTNDVKVILTQWGCKLNYATSSLNPLKGVIARPRSNRDNVVLILRYTDGEPAIDKPFFFKYKEREVAYKSDKQGNKSLGKFLLGSEFEVYDKIEGRVAYLHNFKVEKGKSYVVTFPVLTQADIQVINQKKIIIPQARVNVTYKNEVRLYDTGKTGTLSLPYLEVGEVLDVKLEEDPTIGKTATLNRNTNLYFLQVYRPIFVDGLVKVSDQEGKPLVNYEVRIRYQGNEEIRKTNFEGEIPLSQLEVGKNLRVSSVEEPQYSLEKEIEEVFNTFLLQIKIPVFTDVIVKVVDQKGNTIPNYKIRINHKEAEKILTTNEQGIFLLEDLEVGHQLRVSSVDNPEFAVSGDILESGNEFILRIELPEPKLVKVFLLNEEGKILPGIPIEFRFHNDNDTHFEPTNSEGYCTIPYEKFTHNKRVKTGVFLHKAGETKPLESYTKEEKKKALRKSFIFNQDRLEYVLQLKKPTYWWLLWFLLLLPLLLLIGCEKTIYVKAIDKESKRPIEKASVSLSYQKAFIYDFEANQFWVHKDSLASDSTNAQGWVAFNKLRYSVYSYLFRNKSKAKIKASCNCYDSLAVDTIFHKLTDKDTLTLQLVPQTVDMDFKVVDREDNEPLNSALVRIKSEFNGKVRIDTARSEADGRVTFKIVRCATIRELSASIDGYFPDSLTNKSIKELAGTVDDNRCLKLRPQKENIAFFVTDCQTGQPIPNAVATIDLNLDGKKRSFSVKTNVNGVGKGNYDSLFVLADVMISAEKKYYKRGSMNKAYKVRDFVNLTDKARTFCLEPDEGCIEFFNVDQETKKPLAGVRNIIRVVSGGKVKTDTILSNKNGYFQICQIKASDTITIRSTYPPNYEDNKSQVKNVSGESLMGADNEKRTIPLKPKEVELVFRTVEANSPNTLVPNAQLQITIDGKSVANPNNSGNGIVKIKAFATSIISITAFKKGYYKNNTKVQNASFSDLLSQPQHFRDIPLIQEPPACNEPPQESGGFGVHIKSYDMKDKRVAFDLVYDMNNIPDRLIIYCGQDTKGKILYDTGWISGTGVIPINLSLCQDTWITIKIEGGDIFTNWSYQFICKQNL